MEYRIQKRSMSSNIIEKRIIGENGKESWVPFLAPLGPLCGRFEGDIVADKILKFLNK